MTLRTRIAAAAGLAVALAVVVAAVAVYVGVRAQLRGEVDDSLEARAELVLDRFGGAAGPATEAGRAGSAGRAARQAAWRDRPSASAGPRATSRSCCPAGACCASRG